MVVWSGGPLTPAGTKVFDGASNRSPSTCLKTPQSGFLEEAEAVPAESNGSQRKTTQRLLHSLFQLRGLKAIKLTTRSILFKQFWNMCQVNSPNNREQEINRQCDKQNTNDI